MRTIVDIPDDLIKALDRLGTQEDVSRAELVRRAVQLYLDSEQERAVNESAAAVDKYYGFLQDCPEAFGGMDGLEYQRQIRGEWGGRDQDYAKWGFQDQPAQPYEHPYEPPKKKE